MAEVIVALDKPTAAGAYALVDELGDRCSFYKVGLELYTREGPAVVAGIQQRGARVFLDLKLHDIPATVGRVKEKLLPLPGSDSTQMEPP